MFQYIRYKIFQYTRYINRTPVSIPILVLVSEFRKTGHGFAGV